MSTYLIDASGAGSPGQQDSERYLGYKFHLTAAKVVTALGAYKDPAHNWADPKVVTVWRVSDQVIMGTATITAAEGNAATPVNRVAYKAVTPFALAANVDYVVAAFYGSNTDSFVLGEGPTIADPSLVSFPSEFYKANYPGFPDAGNAPFITASLILDDPAPGGATSYTLSASGTSPVTITATANAAVAGSNLVITLHDDQASTISGTITIAIGATTGTATVTPSASGTHNITATHTGGGFTGGDGSTSFVPGAASDALTAISGLSARIFARYKVGSTLSVSASDGGAVSALNDCSGHGRNLAKGGSAAITYHASGPNGKPYLTIANGAGLSLANFVTSGLSPSWCVIAVWRMIAGSDEPLLCGGQSLRVQNATVGPPQGYKVGGEYRPLQATSRSRNDGWHALCQSVDSNSSAYAVPVESMSIDFGNSYNTNGGDILTVGAALQIPRSLDGSYGGVELAELIVLDRKPTWAQYHKIQEYLRTEYGLHAPAVDDPIHLICVGNSTTRQGYPYYLGRRLTDLGAVSYNMGIDSGTASTLDAQNAEITERITDLVARGKQVYVVVQHGQNNGFGQGSIDTLKGATVQGWRTAGAKVIFVTPMAKNTVDSTVEAARQAQIAWMLSSAALPYCDGRADLGSDAHPHWAYGANTTYPSLWADADHPSVLLGEDDQAAILEPTFRSLLVPAGYPAPSDVRSGVAYGPTANLVGTATIPSLANTKIGVAGDGGTGTYDGSDRYADPGVGNVLAGTTYRFNAVGSANRTGTLVGGDDFPTTTEIVNAVVPAIEAALYDALATFGGTFLTQAEFEDVPVKVNLDQPLADATTPTLGGALNGMHAVAWCKQAIVGNALRVFSFGSTSVPKKTFALDNGDNPKTRTPQ